MMNGNQMETQPMITSLQMESPKIPIWHKWLLTVEEASQYSGIGLHKIRELINADDCEFVMEKGSHKMVKRQKFEKFLDKAQII